MTLVVEAIRALAATLAAPPPPAALPTRHARRSPPRPAVAVGAVVASSCALLALAVGGRRNRTAPRVALALGVLASAVATVAARGAARGGGDDAVRAPVHPLLVASAPSAPCDDADDGAVGDDGDAADDVGGGDEEEEGEAALDAAADRVWLGLKKYSLLSVRNRTGSVHRLLGASLRAAMPPAAAARALAAATLAVERLWRFDAADPTTWSAAVRALEHVQASAVVPSSPCLGAPHQKWKPSFPLRCFIAVRERSTVTHRTGARAVFFRRWVAIRARSSARARPRKQ